MMLKVFASFVLFTSRTYIERLQVIESRGAEFLLFFIKYNAVPLLTPNIISQYAHVRIFFSYTLASSF